MKMIAGGLKIGGQTDVAAALAMGVMAPEMAVLAEDNARLRKQLTEEQRRRWRRNAEKLAKYRANMKPVPWWKDYAGALVLALQSLGRLFVVRER